MVDILALGAHPDDIEFGCGGILAKAASQGRSILMVDLTLGEKATNGTPELRRLEGLTSAELIGAKRLSLDFSDCEIVDDYPSRLKLVELFRTYTPRLILAPMWKGEQNHPDHLACGVLARYASRYCRFAKILPHLPVWSVEGVLHYLPHPGGAADILIDVTGQLATWKAMMACHASQMQTYPYAERALCNAAQLGSMIGVPYAQGLVAGNPIIVDDVLSVARMTREL